ncbi:MAG: hypothetical protein WDO15_29380 [Bacteroidota bacterium]
MTDVTNGAALVVYNQPETYGKKEANCYDAAAQQLKNNGQSSIEKKWAIEVQVDNPLQTKYNRPQLDKNAIGAAIYIRTELNKCHGVLVGLEEINSNGTFSYEKNYNVLTGHFVMINSSTGIDSDGKMAFGYMDNASAACGISNGNKLSLNFTTGSMRDDSNPCVGGPTAYQVTEVRKNQ